MDDNKIAEMRKTIFLTAYSASIAHIASAYSIVEILYVLYNNILRVDPKNPDWEERDLFILSKGHGSLALYTVLADKGFFSKEMLSTFSKPGSVLGGEPCIPDIPGVEASTGSLGHGLSIGVGMALAKKLDGRKERVYVLLGDGECEEGTVWEAIMFAAKEGLSNLTAIIDCNELQKMGRVDDIMRISSWKERFSSFGWDVLEADGHDIEALKNVFEKDVTTVPRVVLAHTTKGKGVSVCENDPRWHWKLPNKKELKAFMSELGITEEELEACRKHI